VVLSQGSATPFFRVNVCKRLELTIAQELAMTEISEITMAPEFALTDVNGKMVRLSDYRGTKHIILVFNRGFI